MSAHRPCFVEAPRLQWKFYHKLPAFASGSTRLFSYLSKLSFDSFLSISPYFGTDLHNPAQFYAFCTLSAAGRSGQAFLLLFPGGEVRRQRLPFSSIVAAKIAYPFAGSFTSTWVSTAARRPFCTIGEPLIPLYDTACFFQAASDRLRGSADCGLGLFRS